MTLTEFLEARIAEDEVWATDLVVSYTCSHSYSEAHKGCAACAITDLGTRVLAQCGALRGAIEAAWADHLQIEGEWGSCRGQDALSAANDYPAVLQWLALPYADHPDFDPTWRLA